AADDTAAEGGVGFDVGDKAHGDFLKEFAEPCGSGLAREEAGTAGNPLIQDLQALPATGTEGAKGCREASFYPSGRALPLIRKGLVPVISDSSQSRHLQR
ncbi:hypothetical protein, partial [Mesorhizobium japonicum]|uniref:hypothetical protein n=1 Tax=Mesorhizobium japonicum TaxID=2066070 RepID=UPI003B5BAE1D